MTAVLVAVVVKHALGISNCWTCTIDFFIFFPLLVDPYSLLDLAQGFHSNSTLASHDKGR